MKFKLFFKGGECNFFLKYILYLYKRGGECTF
jgi:hypothetical protein